MEFTTAEILALGWAGLLGVFIGLGYLIRSKADQQAGCDGIAHRHVGPSFPETLV